MNGELPTRVWLSGMEVDLVKWLPNAMVYTRLGSQETVASLNRSTVARLLEDGTLQIEGYRPDWVHDLQRDTNSPA
ncbi:MAG: hypothetical protein GYB65_17445 [Chloroflexi bacterium]|nr:hypothetical protein [Chloroflexota bacterium]